MKPRRKPAVIPEPSPRTVIWVIAAACVMLCGIIAFDYAIGDRRVALSDPHIMSKPIHFKKAG